MRQRSPQTEAQLASRLGFTILELMIVIIIIAVLASLLLGAVQGGITKARVVSVVVEIKNLEKAIADFKQIYGVEPPSSITLQEQLNKTWDARSKALILDIFPDIDLTNPCNKTNAMGVAVDGDINGDGTSSAITLNGSECLAFFLGGILVPDAQSGASKWTATGFSKDPQHPFADKTTSPNRVGPFYEFLPGRFSDVDGNHNAEYRDPIPSQEKPYLYFSSYAGKGYNSAEQTSTGFTVYYQPPYTAATFTSWKANSFQIISPGFDYQYGTGGYYDSSDPSSVTKKVIVNTSPTPNTLQVDSTRFPERDNITNLSAGMMNP